MSTNNKGGTDVFTHFRKRRTAGVLAFVIAGVIGVGAYAFTASNTVPAHKAGAGAGEVSGYEVTSHVSYTFSGNGEYMTEAHFKLSEKASDVQVALTKEAPVAEDWTDCGASTGAENEVACEFKKATAFAANGVPDGEGKKLSVAAVSEGKVEIE